MCVDPFKARGESGTVLEGMTTNGMARLYLGKVIDFADRYEKMLGVCAREHEEGKNLGIWLCERINESSEWR